jgi:hypothetical protein
MVLIDEAGRLSAKWRLAVRVASDPTLPALAYRLFPILLESVDRQTGLCDYATRTFAAKFSAPPSRIRATFAALAQAGYLTIEHRGGKVTSKGTTNAYRPAYELVARAEIAEGTELSPRVVSLRGRNCPPETVAEGTKTICSEGTESSPTPVKSLPLRERGAIAPAADEETGKHPPGLNGKHPSPAKRDGKLYLAKHGCTIDSYQPNPETMGAWAAQHVPLVRHPVAPETIEAIKDVWRHKGIAPKDFDATLRTYLRKRNEWAAEKPGKVATKPAGPFAPRSAAEVANLYEVGAGNG